RVYGRALSEAELKAMAQDPIKTPTDGVAGSWAFDEKDAPKDDSPAAKLAAQAGLQQPYRTELLGADGKE
ncbi:MAG TPA: hypothetical protein VNA25_18960, partial [Phycisphaerae bacterium]|nr:hypothetical protein [Phycisphaerae bacterium]